MIKVRFEKQHMEAIGGPDMLTVHIKALDVLQDWCLDRGLTWLKNGSNVEHLEPGEVCLQSHDPINFSERMVGIWDHRKICFSDHDMRHAIAFVLTFK